MPVLNAFNKHLWAEKKKLCAGPKAIREKASEELVMRVWRTFVVVSSLASVGHGFGGIRKEVASRCGIDAVKVAGILDNNRPVLYPRKVGS